MEFHDLVSLCSLAIFSMSLTLSIWSFTQNTRSSRVLQVSRLHEAWWGSEMMEVRDKVFQVCKDHIRGGAVAKSLVDYFQSPYTVEQPSSFFAFSKLMGFFCNLEVSIAAGLLDEKLTIRLFGESNYADYQPLIAAVRQAVHDAHPDRRELPLWLAVTVNLEKRFARCGVKFAK